MAREANPGAASGPLAVGGERLAMTLSCLSPPLEVYLLGLVDFEDVQQLQRRLVYDLGERGGGVA